MKTFWVTYKGVLLVIREEQNGRVIWRQRNKANTKTLPEVKEKDLTVAQKASCEQFYNNPNMIMCRFDKK